MTNEEMERLKKTAEELDKKLKEKFSEEKWRVYKSVDDSEEEQNKLIEELGKEKYDDLLDEIINDLKSEIN